MKKTSQKIFPRVTALMLAVVSTFGFFAKAVKPPLPRGDYRVFNVAIIGSDVVGDRAIEESPGFNKNIIENLCNVGTKLENFAEVGVLDENKISLAGRELPRSSMILPEQRIIFCYYDVANVYTNPEVIRECPYALCPYTLNLSESYDAWTVRSTRLRDFVKTRNEMCDLRYSTVVEGEFTEEIGRYIDAVNEIAARSLDVYEYQQTVECRGAVLHGSDPARYARVINDTIYWDREEEFKQCMGKSFPTITCYRPRIAPIFFQEGETHSLSAPPIAPIIQRARPVAPESEASEGSKKKSEQMPHCSGSCRSRSVACDIYRDWFILPQPNRKPLMCGLFDGIIATACKNGFDDEDIINGLQKIELKDNRLYIKIARWCPPHFPGVRCSSATDIFRKDEVREAFEKLFEECLNNGWTRKQIETALCTLTISPMEKFSKYYHIVQSDEILMKEGDVCGIQ